MERERERDIKQGNKDKRIVLKGKGGKEGYIFVKLGPLKAKAFFHFLTEPSSDQMCSRSPRV